MIVDTRGPYSYTHRHIAGALNLPMAKFDSYYPDFASQVDNNQTVILYCDAGCDAKKTIAERLREHGYQDLNMMTEGRAGFRAFHEGTKGRREADFLLLRRRLAEGACWGPELIDEVLAAAHGKERVER